MLQQDSNELETECGVATSGPEPAWEAEWKALDRRLREHARPDVLSGVRCPAGIRMPEDLTSRHRVAVNLGRDLR